MKTALGCKKKVFLLVVFLYHGRPCADVGFEASPGSWAPAVVVSVLCDLSFHPHAWLTISK